jgi:hypothetical protein
MKKYQQLEDKCESFLKKAKGKSSKNGVKKTKTPIKLAPKVAPKPAPKPVAKPIPQNQKNEKDITEYFTKSGKEEVEYNVLKKDFETNRDPLKWTVNGKEVKIPTYVVDFKMGSTKIVTSNNVEINCLLVWFPSKRLLSQNNAPEEIIEWYDKWDARESAVRSNLTFAGKNKNDYVIIDKENGEKGSNLAFYSGTSAPNYTRPVCVIKKEFITPELLKLI